jgi:xylitol oxidase
LTGRRTNWGGNVTFAAGRLHRPSSVPELQHIVAHGDRVRALGAGHSFSPVADTQGDLVSVASLPPLIEVDSERGTVTAGAGLRYGELAAGLDKAGRALANLASLPHISLAGACATGTHGSGNANGSLATAVKAMEMVTADGDLVTVDRAAEPGAVVALGALGIVTRLTLATVATFDIAQYVYEDVPLGQVRDHFDEIFASAYSVSVFTGWRSPWTGRIWLKQRTDEPPPRWAYGRLADGPRHPLPSRPPAICTEQLGIPGRWHERLPHFRPEFTPSTGNELQSEYLLPREHAAAGLDALGRIAAELAPVLQISEIRTVAADDLWLSPAYGRDTAGFHFTWINDWPAVEPVLARLEKQLAPLHARPHWGKLFTTGPAVVRGGYERAGDFRDLMRRYDPAGKFRNDLLDRCFPGMAD